MPQYELEEVGPGAYSGRVRGRTPDEAVRRALDLPDDVDVAVSEETDLHGWQAVQIDGEPAGQVRLHQRMQFRRD